MIRLFAAVAVPEEMGEALLTRADGIPGARWRPLEALHVTLRFFGEVSNPVAAELDEALATIRAPAFDLRLAGAGVFGGADHMRAVWAGVAESAELRHLAAKCETAAKRAGLVAEKRGYRPHVTLAYLRRAEAPKVAAWVQENNLLKSPPWRVESFGLYSSWSGPDGSRYDLERSYPLA